MSDEELIARLRDWPYQGETMANAAADRIEALVKERDEATNQLDSARHSVDVLEKRVAHFMSRAERLEALILKGGDNRRVYMGQIMAECDCPREAECQAAGRCIAEERK